MNLFKYFTLCSVLFSCSNLFAIRSYLYEDDWEPGVGVLSANAQLQDFSYAGFKNSSVETPKWQDFNLPLYRVNDFGADPTGVEYSDAAIQLAIDSATANGGGIILFGYGSYTVSESFNITGSNIFIVGSRHINSSENSQNVTKIWTDYWYKEDGIPENLSQTYGTFRFIGNQEFSNRKNLAENISPHDMFIKLESVDGFNIGDDIAIERNEFETWIDDYEMNEYWSDLIGETKKMESRTIVNIDVPARKLYLNAPVRHFIKSGEGSVSLESGYSENVGMYNIKFNNALHDENYVKKIGGNRMSFIYVRDVKNAVFANIFSYDAYLNDTTHHLADSFFWADNLKDSTLTKIRVQKTQRRIGGGAGYGINLDEASNVLIHDADVTWMRHNYTFNYNSLAKEGNVITKSVSRKAKANHCINEDEITGCILWPTNGIDIKGRATVSTLMTEVTVDDRIKGINRKSDSSNSGDAGWGNVVWNINGDGKVIFKDNQKSLTGYGFVYSYVIAWAPGIKVKGDNKIRDLKKKASTVEPQNLFCDQLSKRGAGSSCDDIQVETTTGLSQNQTECHELLQEINYIEQTIEGLQTTFDDMLNEPEYEYGSPHGFENVLNGLVSQISQNQSQLAILQSQFNGYNEVGCVSIMDTGLAVPINDGVEEVAISDREKERLSKEKIKRDKASQAELEKSGIKKMVMQLDIAGEKHEVQVTLRGEKSSRVKSQEELLKDPSYQKMISSLNQKIETIIQKDIADESDSIGELSTK
ncbi:hypothetical protein N9N67_00900 [Bacteriovoracaceae bacterium]|nr:hypothetical protein [Bacteriovoracaceae bacterium]